MHSYSSSSCRILQLKTELLGYSIVRVIRLDWDADNPSSPILSKIAILPNIAKYSPYGGQGDMHLAGEYIAVDTINEILIWNWKDDTIGVVHPEGREWASICEQCGMAFV